MAKTEETLKLEKAIYNLTAKQGVFGCYEVTIGWFGKERVDYMTYDTKGIFRCYEIKVSKADFYSKAKHTFLGHYNYYVMPTKLYEEVKNDISDYIGVYNSNGSLKKAKKQEVKDEQILKDSMIRSLSRYIDDYVKCQDESIIKGKDRQIRELTSSRDDYRTKYWDLRREIEEKYGTRWNR